MTLVVPPIIVIPHPPKINELQAPNILLPLPPRIKELHEVISDLPFPLHSALLIELPVDPIIVLNLLALFPIICELYENKIELFNESISVPLVLDVNDEYCSSS